MTGDLYGCAPINRTEYILGTAFIAIARDEREKHIGEDPLLSTHVPRSSLSHFLEIAIVLFLHCNNRRFSFGSSSLIDFFLGVIFFID